MELERDGSDTGSAKNMDLELARTSVPRTRIARRHGMRTGNEHNRATGHASGGAVASPCGAIPRAPSPCWRRLGAPSSVPAAALRVPARRRASVVSAASSAAESFATESVAEVPRGAKAPIRPAPAEIASPRARSSRAARQRRQVARALHVAWEAVVPSGQADGSPLRGRRGIGSVGVSTGEQSTVTDS